MNGIGVFYAEGSCSKMIGIMNNAINNERPEPAVLKKEKYACDIIKIKIDFFTSLIFIGLVSE